MKLNHLTAEKVNGFIPLNIEFDHKLNFLIGINGSGKTSALKLILGLLTPSFDFLNQIDYESVQLICSSSNDEKDIIITSKKIGENKYSIEVNISNDASSEIFEKINFESIVDVSLDERNERINQQKQIFLSLLPIKQIIKLNTPVFLGLNRRFEGQTRNEFIYPRHFRIRRRLGHYDQSDNLNVSLLEVQELIFDYFRLIANQQPKIVDKFKNKIFEKYFEFIDDVKSNQPEQIKNMELKKNHVIKAMHSMNLTGFDEYIADFFDKMDNVKKKLESDDSRLHKRIDEKNIDLISKWFVNSSQFNRIDKLLQFSSIYTEEIQKLNSPVKKIEEIISKFIFETEKKITIKGDGQIEVILPNGQLSTIFQLSSGEKQIIIMIAHLIFSEKFQSPGIFIIDEPEVSLHLSWQEIFVNSIMNASPSTQFLLATHSPSIVGSLGNEIYCHDLSPKK